MLVKRDSVLSSALMDFYAPDGTVKDFEQAAKKNIFGFYPQLLPSEDKAINDGNIMGSDEEGFWFVAGSDYMDALVPYKKQKALMKSVNPNQSLANDVHNNLTKDEIDNASQIFKEVINDMKNRRGDWSNGNYSNAVKVLESAKNKLGL